jgi:hypothetical protein
MLRVPASDRLRQLTWPCQVIEPSAKCVPGARGQDAAAPTRETDTFSNSTCVTDRLWRDVGLLGVHATGLYAGPGSGRTTFVVPRHQSIIQRPGVAQSIRHCDACPPAPVRHPPVVHDTLNSIWWISVINHEYVGNSAAGQRLRQATWARGEAPQSRKAPNSLAAWGFARRGYASTPRGS